jgi:hypothetical protein
VKPVAIGGWYTEEVSDDSGWDRQRIVGHQLKAAPVRCAVQQLVGQHLDPPAQALDQTRCERPVDEAAEPRVIWRIQVKHAELE